MRDHHHRPAGRSRRCRHDPAPARHRTPHLPLFIRHAADRNRWQQPRPARSWPDDRRRAGRVRMVDAAAADHGSAVGRDDRGPPTDPPPIDVDRRRPTGAARRIRCVPWPGRCSPPTRRCDGRFRHRKAFTDRARPRDPARVRGWGGAGGGIQRAAWRRAVRRPDSARHVAPTRRGHGIDHVEPRCCGGVPGDPPRACADVAGRAAVVSVRVLGIGHRPARRRCRTRVQPL